MAQTSLRNFLDKIIDYAGLFPPASLDLKSAFYNYLVYKLNSPFSWMLAKFIIPAPGLAELDELIQSEKINIAETLSFSVLGTSSVHSSEFLDSIESDVSLISGFSGKYSGKINIDAFEVRLPNDLFSIKGDNVLFEILKRTSEMLEKIKGKPVSIFFEAPPNENLPLLVEAISKLNKSGGAAGYKLRTGGVEASAFPAPENTAFAIKTCIEAEVPMKCTAGLHHPIRRYDNSVKTKMFGFINVFAAGIQNMCLNLSDEMMVEILEDEDPSDFRFLDGSFMWKEYAVFASRVQEIREKYMISFGSCSFDEPVEDLKGLGLI